MALVKRVIAVGADTIEGKEGANILTGSRPEEAYIQHLGNPPEQLNEVWPVSISPGKLFLMGDNDC